MLSFVMLWCLRVAATGRERHR